MTVTSHVSRARTLADGWGYALAALAARLYMAELFFVPSAQKFYNLLNDNWDATVALYAKVYPPSFLPPPLAAALGTGVELLCIPLLALGLFGRMAAAGLLIIILVTQYELAAEEHAYWMLILALLATKGAGLLSADTLYHRWRRA